MVQTPPLAIQIASMRLPEAIESEALSVTFSRREDNYNEDDRNNVLWIYPGEPEHILVTVENTNHRNDNRNLQGFIKLSGDYPSHWLKSNQTQLRFNIPPNRKINKAISFQAEADFFENQQALSQKTQLKLNYQLQIQVLLETLDQTQIVEYQVFNILVRPETSYLNFLPSIFQERDIARRFVSIFEQAFDPVVQTTDVLWAYFDPLTAPEAFLPFLAKWVGWEIDERWTIQQQRQLIRNAVTLYRWHGTKHGLRLYLHYCTGLPLDEHLPESQKHISIEENFNDGLVLGEVNLDENPMLGGGKPYHFTVRLRTDASNQLDEELVQEIIERQKPAFSTYELSIFTQ